jgi:aspartate/methionine/tyrosine aminotransferase
VPDRRHARFYSLAAVGGFTLWMEDVLVQERPMQFSKRTNWNVEESELARAHRERVEAGLPLADLTASNPTRCGFVYPPDLLDALTDPRALDYDPQPLGMLAARQAVCGYYAARNVKVKPEQITLTTSTSEAYSYLFRLLCDPGDEVISLQPGYPLFDFLAGLDDVTLSAAPLVYDDGWQIEFEGLERAVRNRTNGERTRAIVVVHPNNPTGHFTKQWEKDRLAELCGRHGLSLIVDEVFIDYLEAGNEGTRERRNVKAGSEGTREQGNEGTGSFAAGLEGVPVFVVSGLSKIAGLPQMKAAWIVATGPDTRGAMARLEVIADTFLSMNAPVQWALPRWLHASREKQSQIRARVRANLAALDRALAAAPELMRLKVEGGWYAVLRIPALEPDNATALKLLDRGVWVHPGHFFGMGQSGWLVVSLLAPEAEFSTGVAILVDYFRTHQVSNNSGNQL